ncbi:Tn5468, orf5 [Acidithiobacillus sp. GGI-221]|nr:Tn5468, orf5 [Acidithiobacillus sp. GGI-221]
MRPDPGGNEQQQNGVWAEKLKKKIFEVPGRLGATGGSWSDCVVILK